MSQAAERLAAGPAWTDVGMVFATPFGKPVDPRNDYREWRQLLRDAGVPPARLHDARHTAATLLLTQGVPGARRDGDPRALANQPDARHLYARRARTRPRRRQPDGRRALGLTPSASAALAVAGQSVHVRLAMLGRRSLLLLVTKIDHPTERVRGHGGLRSVLASPFRLMLNGAFLP